ncbi:peptidase [Thraustotheca clavata]|uniref:Peptidase n=1 Tax=Thraustotheca clavata TaxID=74557 RepID=A0A1V9ZF86_9STRA|nr:peptidase [Thraustotheca clavata]
MRWTQVIFAAGAVCPSFTSACTVIGITHGASVDGSSLLAHTDDAGGGTADVRLIRVPAMEFEPGTLREVFNVYGGYPRIVSKQRGKLYMPTPDHDVMKPLGYIPQVNKTFAYFDQDYGMMNEVSLSIAESTCAAKTVGWPSDVPYGYNMMGIGELTKVALERCESARCAIQTMGDLAVKYGFYSEDSGNPNFPGYSDSAEALGISDRFGEMWIFHVLTGPKNASAVWAAQRVPDGHVTAVANTFAIRNMDLNDTENFMASSNVVSFAEEMGWYNASHGPFDFTAAYGPEMIKGFSDSLLALYSGRRLWRIFDYFVPSLKLNSTLGWQAKQHTYPFSAPVDKKVDVTELFTLLRDHYEGTPYDMTKGLAAGPFGNPIRFDGPTFNVPGGWERSIAMYRTMFSFVLQIQPPNMTAVSPSMRGTAWYCQDSPHGSVYLPFAPTQESLPASYITGNQSVFDMNSAWWPFNFVNQWSMLRWNKINADVMETVLVYQGKALELHASLLSQDKAANGSLSFEIIQSQFNTFASNVVSEWWSLAWKLVAKYSCGFITTGEGPGKMQTPGYSYDWLMATDFRGWPGNTYNPPAGIKNPDFATAENEPTITVAVPTQAAVHDNLPTQHRGSKSNIVEIIGYMIMGACLALGSHALITQQKRRDGYSVLQ